MKDIFQKLSKLNQAPDHGKMGWKSPSNIALIKYWGKYDRQLPANPSLSFTLETSLTETHIEFAPKSSNQPVVEFQFEGSSKPAFSDRIQKFIQSLETELPFLTHTDLRISSSNTFPHSSGIASSASSMSALAMCLVSMVNAIEPELLSKNESLKLASYLSRLGSGSACRSVYGGFTIWGKTASEPDSSDLYAIPVEENRIAPVFLTLCDDILIVEKGSKKVSSSAGHGLMKGHPFADIRFQKAHKILEKLSAILKNGEINAFCELVEEEAMMLHALMMTSTPSFILFKPETIAIINEIRQFRWDTSLPVCFTLDAGANVHMIYPSEIQREVRSFLGEKVLGYCENEQYLCDRIGRGPQQIGL